jgi:hypothetical protein
MRPAETLTVTVIRMRPSTARRDVPIADSCGAAIPIDDFIGARAARWPNSLRAPND